MSMSHPGKPAGALRRFKPYQDYKDSGVEWLGEIPKGWQALKLKRVCSLAYGDSLASDSRTDGCVDVYGSNGPVGTHDRANTLAPCLLVGRKGSFGKVNFSGSAVFAIDTTFFVDRRFTRADLRWLYYVLSNAGLDSATRDSAIPGLDREDAYSRDVALPPEPEQRGIAAFLDRETARIDALVAKKERLIELLQEKRTALITRAVNKGLDPTVPGDKSGSEAFPHIPPGWEVRKLRRLITQVRRPIDVDPDAEYQEIGIRSWGRGIFHKQPLKGALLEEKRVFRIEPGDLVLNIIFAWEGAVAVASDEERGMVGSHRFPTFRVSDDVDLDYLLMVLQTEQGRWLMEVNSPGAAGRNRTIRLSQFLDEAISLPPLAEQRELVRRFRGNERRFDALIGRLRDGIAALKELRIALISAAVTGKIDVRPVPAEARAGQGGAA